MEPWIASLAHPEAYGEETGSLDHLQTHLSHVFLSPTRVYKLRKPVRFGFVDFSTRALRAADCERELTLNRRISPGVYLGVAPVRLEGAVARVGPMGQHPDPEREWLVVMKRLPAGGDLQSRLEAGELSMDEIAQVAEQLAAFHRDHALASPAPFGEADWRARQRDPVKACFDELAATPGLDLTGFDLPALAQRTSALAERLAPVFERRRVEGRAVDGHGDLRLEHLWRDERGHVQVIDCVEFDASLRQIDAACDLAFLSMDLRHHARADLAEWLLGAYAAHADDYELYDVLSYFEVYRALVRAKVAALRASDADIDPPERERARRSLADHLVLARERLETGPAGLAVLLCGTVGSGKSTAARALARGLPGVVISSDRVRKGLPPFSDAPDPRRSGGWGEGGYSEAAKDGVYDALLERARAVLESGRIPILDASFSKRRWRDAAARWCRERGARAVLVETACATEVGTDRLAARARAGRDPSDAGPELLGASISSYEPPEEWPATARLRVRSDAPDWARRLEQAAPRLRESDLRTPR